MLTGRLEKHGGLTLIVNAPEKWIDVVVDGTGNHFEGPVQDDADVRRVVRIIVPALQALNKGGI